MSAKKIGLPAEKAATRPLWYVPDTVLSFVAYFRDVFVNFPTAGSLLADYIKHFQDTPRYIFLLDLLFEEPLDKLESNEILNFQAFISNIIELLCYEHL